MEFIERLINALTKLHPLHSMTVHFPIALTATALFFLLLALWKRDKSLELLASLNLGLASVSTIVAGLTGLRDNILRYDGSAPNVNAKIFLAISLVVLTGLASYSRWRKPEILWMPSTRILYLAAFLGSFALAATLGFLGGVILYGF